MKKAMKLFDKNNEEFIHKIQGKDYIIYFLSEIKMGKNAKMSDLYPEEELLEAHFFDPKEYLHLYPYEEGIYAAAFEDEGDEDFIEEELLLRYKTMREIRCRKYIAYDVYGQAYVEMTRPVELGRREKNGEK